MNAWTRNAARVVLILLVPCGPASRAVGAEAEPGPAAESWLRHGTPIRARVGAADSWTQGTFEQVRGDSLYVAVSRGAAEPRLVPLDIRSVRRFERSRESVPRTWKGFAIGFLALGAAGALTTAADREVDNKGAGALVGFMVFGPLGALLGAVIGSSVESERWVATEIPDPPTQLGRAGEEHETRNVDTGGER